MTADSDARSAPLPPAEATGCFETLCAAMGNGFAICELSSGPGGAPRDFVVRAANRVFGEHFGLSVEEILSRTGSALLQPAELGDWVARLSASLEGGSAQRFEHRSRCAGRQLVVCACGFGGGIVAVGLEDVTDRQRVERERTEFENKLLQAQKMEAIGQLAGGIAHDFNNILAALIMQLNMLRIRAPISPVRLERAIDEMLDSANRATGLTRQLLLLGRGHPMQTARHDLNEILRGLRDLLAHAIDERIALVFELGEDPLWFEGDAGMIEQVVMNLCVNARDAMPEGGRLTIATRHETFDETTTRRAGATRPGAHVCVEVSDTGSGIEPRLLERVFDPFFTTKAQSQGTGLGLATVRSIATKHGGFVEVRSEVGRGSAFGVHLPGAPAGSPAETRRSAAAPLGGTERILVVEDQAPVRYMTVDCLHSLGYRTEEAEDGPEALQVWEAERGRFDLLLTDMVMPGGMSGLDLCVRLRERAPGLPTVITSGYSTELVHVGPLPEPCFVFLPKPYDIAALAAAIRRCLGKENNR
jgi:signal transduction histidine kinase/ActR/RegA family two-component response regulator